MEANTEFNIGLQFATNGAGGHICKYIGPKIT